MVPITLVTGFLGAGKTTLLSHVLQDPQGLRIAVLVNDFGAVNIDAELLRETGEEIISLENGCICCSLSQGLLATVRGVLQRHDLPDRILIEASGVSDPFEIVETLSDPELRDYAPLDGVIAVVDAGMALFNSEILSLAQRQVACAGLVLLNKVDIGQGNEVRAWIRSVSPKVTIIPTQQSSVPLPTLFCVGSHVDTFVGNAVVPNFESNDLLVKAPISLQSLHNLLSALPRGIFRAKGTVNLVEKPAHRCHLQVSGGQATLTVGQAWGEDPIETRLVFIGLSGSLDSSWLEAQLGLS
ncbi:CobW family GTP-binding protein [Halomonas sp. GT]|uniref:CobW family GTP-binding protein n=1 Tax=Halomonas sp. GT TaxID=1971364 RepID=UPI0009F50713|nr:CobW family GTP-binding protein [Halomonas sp. GT]